MTAATRPFAELGKTLARFLAIVPATGDALLQASLPLLHGDAARAPAWPAWLALRDLAFHWRMHSTFDGEEPFLFGSGETARDMLHAELSVRLRPAPRDEPPPAALPSPATAPLVFPPLVVRPSPPDAPPASLLLRLGPDETLLVWPELDARHREIDATRIAGTWTRAGATTPLPRGGRRGGAWPLTLFLSVARALGNPSAAPGQRDVFGALDATIELWHVARGALTTAGSMQPSLDGARRLELHPPALGQLAHGWRVASYALHVRPLVTARGELARRDEEETFVAPLRITLEAGDLQSSTPVVLEPPDIAAAGELRTTLLESFARRDVVQDLAELLAGAAPGGVRDRDIRRWCDPAQATAAALRVARTADTDDYVFVLSGEVAGVLLAAIVGADDTTVRMKNGALVVEDLGDLEIGYAGRVADVALPWRRGTEWLARALTTLVRWRTLLP